jgi:hypothetical protein
MVTEYGSDTVSLQPAKLGDAEFHAIGRLIRACADIEDLLTLSIADLMLVNETALVVALGQTPMSKKLSIGNYLAAVRAQDMPARYKHCFDAEFKEIVACRNAAAHGILLGQWPNGK